MCTRCPEEISVWTLAHALFNLKKGENQNDLKKSFPYKEIDVSFNNKESEITISGTLTLTSKEDRHTEDRHTAVILISGSGPSDRDSTFLGHKPFRIMADYFARKEVTVLRLSIVFVRE